MTSVKEARINRKKRHLRIRKNVSGTGDKPRLSVCRSLRHIYAQISNDVEGHTVVSASTLDPDIKASPKSKSEEAKMVGAILGKRALDKGINTVVFDRGGFKYHGRVKSLADGAREAGLKF